MKKVLVLAILAGLSSILYAADELYHQYGSYEESISSETAISISSYTYTTLPRIYLGAQRIITNNSTETTVYMRKSTSTAIATQGTPIFKQQQYIEGVYMGNIYLQVPAGAAPVDVRYEYLKRKN